MTASVCGGMSATRASATRPTVTT
uniref:Uncharacterized protein n=1 Tax=Timema shepardi TaxID=629360 RepID=A0A7R9B8Z1_TIMSH|nr:unnamed protein product [Timema shepardi]